MPIRVSPITTRKRSSSKNRTAYKNMHNRAFPNNAPALNAYKKMHERAFPTSSKLSLKAYKKMHHLAFPMNRGTRSRSRSRS